MKNGEIWLPNICTIDNNICSHRQNLELYFTIEKVSTSKLDQNPLFSATDRVRADLRLCNPPLDNSNQLKYLTDYSPYPFYKLTIKDSFASEMPLTTCDTFSCSSVQCSRSPARSGVGRTSLMSRQVNDECIGDRGLGSTGPPQSCAKRVVIDLTGDDADVIMA